MAAASLDGRARVDLDANQKAQLPVFGSTVDSDRRNHQDRLGLHCLRDVAYTVCHPDPIAGASAARDAGHSDVHCEVRYRELGRDSLPSALEDALASSDAQTGSFPPQVARSLVAYQAVVDEFPAERLAAGAQQSVVPVSAKLVARPAVRSALEPLQACSA